MVDHLISRRWVSIIVCKQSSRGIHEQKLHRTFCVYVKLCHSVTGGCRDTRLRLLGASGAPSREQREYGTQRSHGSVHTACTYGVWQAGMNPARPSTASTHRTHDADAAAATSRRGHGCGCGRGYSMQQHKRAAHVWMTIWVLRLVRRSSLATFTRVLVNSYAILSPASRCPRHTERGALIAESGELECRIHWAPLHSIVTACCCCSRRGQGCEGRCGAGV